MTNITPLPTATLDDMSPSQTYHQALTQCGDARDLAVQALKDLRRQQARVHQTEASYQAGIAIVAACKAVVVKHPLTSIITYWADCSVGCSGSAKKAAEATPPNAKKAEADCQGAKAAAVLAERDLAIDPDAVWVIDGFAAWVIDSGLWCARCIDKPWIGKDVSAPCYFGRDEEGATKAINQAKQMMNFYERQEQ